MYDGRRREKPRALTLIELLVAAVILGVVAALAIPRLSHAAPRDRAEELRHALAVVRTAIELYYDDHGAYPGAGLENAEEASDAFVIQLSADSAASHQENRPSRLGPYLAESMPSCPVADCAHASRVAVRCGAHELRGDPTLDAGWIYDPQTGHIIANSTQMDANGARFDQY